MIQALQEGTHLRTLAKAGFVNEKRKEVEIAEAMDQRSKRSGAEIWVCSGKARTKTKRS